MAPFAPGREPRANVHSKAVKSQRDDEVLRGCQVHIKPGTQTGSFECPLNKISFSSTSLFSICHLSFIFPEPSKILAWREPTATFCQHGTRPMRSNRPFGHFNEASVGSPSAFTGPMRLFAKMYGFGLLEAHVFRATRQELWAQSFRLQRRRQPALRDKYKAASHQHLHLAIEASLTYTVSLVSWLACVFACLLVWSLSCFAFLLGGIARAVVPP